MDYDICGRILRCVYDIFIDNGLSEYNIKKTYLQVPNDDRKVETYIINFGSNRDIVIAKNVKYDDSFEIIVRDKASSEKYQATFLRYYSTVSISFKIFNNGFDLNFGDFLVKDKDSILYHNNGIEASQYLFIPSAEYSFCNILAAAINKSNFDEVKKLWEQK